jgi:hypothetical protein
VLSTYGFFPICDDPDKAEAIKFEQMKAWRLTADEADAATAHPCVLPFSVW